jgi:hypothetical protein
MRTQLTLLVAFALLSADHRIGAPSPAAALPNDNREAAGRLTQGVLRVQLEAREARRAVRYCAPGVSVTRQAW